MNRQNGIKQFYKPNLFKIVFVIIFGLLVFLSSINLLSCSPDFGGKFNPIRCNFLAEIVGEFSFIYMGLLYVPQASTFSERGATIFNQIIALIIHIIISYNIASLIYYFWQRRKYKK